MMAAHATCTMNGSPSATWPTASTTAADAGAAATICAATLAAAALSATYAFKRDVALSSVSRAHRARARRRIPRPVPIDRVDPKPSARRAIEAPPPRPVAPPRRSLSTAAPRPRAPAPDARAPDAARRRIRRARVSSAHRSRARRPRRPRARPPVDARRPARADRDPRSRARVAPSSRPPRSRPTARPPSSRARDRRDRNPPHRSARVSAPSQRRRARPPRVRANAPPPRSSGRRSRARVVVGRTFCSVATRFALGAAAHRTARWFFVARALEARAVTVGRAVAACIGASCAARARRSDRAPTRARAPSFYTTFFPRFIQSKRDVTPPRIGRRATRSKI